MEKVTYLNLPIAGTVQHGEQKEAENGKTRPVELGYFIAKIKDKNMQVFLNRFNEKLKGRTFIDIYIFNEEPFSVQRARFNQSRKICYCLDGQTQGKQNISGEWKNIECSEECEYRKSKTGKPACSEEGTLKFMIPSISTDRIWTMKIKSHRAIEQLKAYFSFQKQLNNPIVGNYVLFLKQVEQSNSITGKKYRNIIVDIVKKEDFNPGNVDNKEEISTKNVEKVENYSEKTVQSVNKNTTKTKKEESKRVTKTSGSKEQIKENKTIKQDNANKSSKKLSKEDFGNYYCLLSTNTITLLKKGVSTEYTQGKFVDINDKEIDVIVNKEDGEELKMCDLGTQVKMNVIERSGKKFAMDLQFITKLKKVAA